MTDEEAKAAFDKERGKWTLNLILGASQMEMTDNKAS